MNSAPVDVPCTQNSDAAGPERSATSPTASLNAIEPVEHGGARTIIVPVLTIEPAAARMVVGLSQARAVSMAPAPKLSAVTIDVSADSTAVPIRTPFPNVAAGRALMRE